MATDFDRGHELTRVNDGLDDLEGGTIDGRSEYAGYVSLCKGEFWELSFRRLRQWEWLRRSLGQRYRRGDHP